MTAPQNRTANASPRDIYKSAPLHIRTRHLSGRLVCSLHIYTSHVCLPSRQAVLETLGKSLASLDSRKGPAAVRRSPAVPVSAHSRGGEKGMSVARGHNGTRTGDVIKASEGRSRFRRFLLPVLGRYSWSGQSAVTRGRGVSCD